MKIQKKIWDVKELNRKIIKSVSENWKFFSTAGKNTFGKKFIRIISSVEKIKF